MADRRRAVCAPPGSYASRSRAARVEAATAPRDGDRDDRREQHCGGNDFRPDGEVHHRCVSGERRSPIVQQAVKTESSVESKKRQADAFASRAIEQIADDTY